MQKGLGAIAAASLLVAASEGLILHARPDIATGHANICYGDTHNVKPGDTATVAECKARLAVQVANADAVVDSCIPPPPTAQIRAALDDFAYNFGPGEAGQHDGLCVLASGQPSTLRKRAEAGDWRGVCNGLLAWRKGWAEMPGLKARRYHERELCLSGLKP